MGATMDLRTLDEQGTTGRDLTVVATAPGTLQQIDWIRSGELLDSVPCGGSECAAALVMDDLRPGEYAYVRVLQIDGGAAWSSPFFFR